MKQTLLALSIMATSFGAIANEHWKTYALSANNNNDITAILTAEPATATRNGKTMPMDFAFICGKDGKTAMALVGAHANGNVEATLSLDNGDPYKIKMYHHGKLLIATGPDSHLTVTKMIGANKIVATYTDANNAKVVTTTLLDGFIAGTNRHFETCKQFAIEAKKVK